MEAGDADLRATALREATEEMGPLPPQLDFVGEPLLTRCVCVWVSAPCFCCAPLRHDSLLFVPLDGMWRVGLQHARRNRCCVGALPAINRGSNARIETNPRRRGKRGQKHFYTFHARLAQPFTPVLNDEHNAHRYFSLDELAAAGDADLHPVVRLLLREPLLRQRLGGGGGGGGGP